MNNRYLPESDAILAFLTGKREEFAKRINLARTLTISTNSDEDSPVLNFAANVVRQVLEPLIKGSEEE